MRMLQEIFLLLIAIHITPSLFGLHQLWLERAYDHEVSIGIK
jgi:hypothetical protein